MTGAKILIFDFGSQTCHLIFRRLRDLGIQAKIIDSKIKISQLKKMAPAGLIFSGGPASVYETGAPKINSQIFRLGLPILGICYGWQLMAYLLNGKVISSHREYGPQKLEIKNLKTEISQDISQTSIAWFSHGDTVVKLPSGVKIIGSTKNVKAAFVVDKKRKFFGVQFHPEVQHTKCGQQILQNFVSRVCSLKIKKRAINFKKIISKIKAKVKNDLVIGAVSGGVDSTTAAALVSRAIGKNFYPVYIQSGLMRLNTVQEVKDLFQKQFQLKPIIVPSQKLFLEKLAGVVDPEKKRKIIGRLYISLFEKQARRIKGIKYLCQGTIYSDVIESKGTKNASKIKSHHNVGGLPQKMKLKLLEPLRFFYKDEVRLIAKKLGLAESIVQKQPFPGPGQAIRIIGVITQERLAKQQQADQIVLEELKKAGWLKKVFQAFPVMTGIKSTAVKGDSRVYGEVVALRVYESSDIMTAGWAKLPYGLLQQISSRIVNEIKEVSRVVYDITTKPPATMEWE